MQMLRIAYCLVALLLLVSCQRTAQSLTTFDTRQDPAFGDASAPLRAFLTERHPAAKGPQHFCAVGLIPESGNKLAWVHWTEGNQLVLWEGGSSALASSRRQLDLKDDVVATEADVKGSTYLVTRAWVDGILSACKAHGAQYTLEDR